MSLFSTKHIAWYQVLENTKLIASLGNNNLRIDTYGIMLKQGYGIATSIINNLKKERITIKVPKLSKVDSLIQCIDKNRKIAENALLMTNTTIPINSQILCKEYEKYRFEHKSLKDLLSFIGLYLDFVRYLEEYVGKIKTQLLLLDQQVEYYLCDNWVEPNLIVKELTGVMEITQLEFNRHIPTIVNYFNEITNSIDDIETSNCYQFKPREGYWEQDFIELPEKLKSIVGIERNPSAEQREYQNQPIHDWDMTHAEPVKWYHQLSAQVFDKLTPIFKRNYIEALKVRWSHKEISDKLENPKELRKLIENKAKSLGISAIGVAKLNHTYNCREHADLKTGTRVIVCLLEQSYESVLAIPSWNSEQAAQECTLQLQQKNIKLSEYINELGYQAMANPRWLAIPYAVDAGLGQLGLNGQLLTAKAGSRCRLELISTNMPLNFDSSVDIGVPSICDACRICVRRCPPGAIPLKRREYRGIVKAKLNTARCFPIVAQAAGCAICLKVCPVQRYGLKAVIDNYEQTGNILGSGTEELEGYHFMDGSYYDSNSRPKLSENFTKPDGFIFDPNKWHPDSYYKKTKDELENAIN